ncbi:M48 family metallopeptidase [Streptomyces sp. NBC_00726]|uniref:M48 family metallopeptidase n=1 Tax=Streptomyces sp. NBC_00726 TaxID=2903674 RepID=UPI0038697A4A
MLDAVEQRIQCPECGAEIRTHHGFVRWCAGCDWNVDPGQPEEPAGRLDVLRRRLAQRHGEAPLTEVTTGEAPRPRRDTAGVLALALAVAVHGVTAALVVGGVLLVVLGWGGALPVIGAVCLIVALVLRPRFGKLPDDAPVLLRADAPELFSLVDEVAAVVGTRGVDAVVVDGEFNASVSTYGIRQRRVLTLGLGLWEVLTPGQRLALLGHELGHYANGDSRHGFVTGNALRSLDAWVYLLGRTEQPTPGEAVLNGVLLLPRCAVTGVLLLLDRLTLRATQRAEYLADDSAARCGSTEAATGLMDRLLIADSAAVVLLRESNSAQTVRRTDARDAWRGLWDRLAAHLDTVPESERERLRRAGARRGHSVDATHPPTHLRRARLLASSPVPAAVTTDAAREAALGEELAGARERVARQILNGR